MQLFLCSCLRRMWQNVSIQHDPFFILHSTINTYHVLHGQSFQLHWCLFVRHRLFKISVTLTNTSKCKISPASDHYLFIVEIQMLYTNSTHVYHKRIKGLYKSVTSLWKQNHFYNYPSISTRHSGGTISGITSLSLVYLFFMTNVLMSYIHQSHQSRPSLL